MKQHITTRPTGATAAIAGLLVTVAAAAGLDISPEAAASIVGGVAAVVSVFTPRG